MTEENKTEYTPCDLLESSMLFKFGFKVGYDLGELQARLNLAERDIKKLTATVDELKSRLAAKPRQD